jgi:UDP-N-acetylmuramoyl-tripeptide--D-alanyl-D-alanine ligase
MKNLFKSIITYLFKVFAHIYLAMNKIEVVAITGSAGKSTARMALRKFIKEQDLYVPLEGYNTEIGVPLAIFGESIPEEVMNPLLWTNKLFKIFGKLFKKPPYQRIALEMGADKPGDIRYLTSFIKPKIAIVTTVLPVHTEEFKTIENIAKEKGRLVEALSKKGTAILNADNRYVRMMAGRTKGKVIFVGEDKSANIRWEKLTFKPTGLHFVLYVRGQKYSVKTKIIAPQLLISLLSAFAVGLVLNYEVRDLINSLAEFTPEKGRMNVLEGQKKTTIIDDSYNANPASVIAALDVLGQMPGRKIAVLGSMRELGGLEKKGHIDVAKKAAAVADELVTVGMVANNYLAPEYEKLNKKSVQKFISSKEAGEYVNSIIKEGDVILFKGSQNTIFMEEAVKQVMAKSKEADRLLVRQSKMWEDKKRESQGGN